MILRLALSLGALDAKRGQIAAQPCERTLVQESGEIIRAVGKKFATAKPDEEIEKFALDALDLSGARRLSECGMRYTKRTRIAAQFG